MAHILIVTHDEGKGSKIYDLDVDNIIKQKPEDPNYGHFIKKNGRWILPSNDLADEIYIRVALDLI